MHELDSYGTETGTSNHFVMGLLVGAAVGAAVGLLFAPKAGSELRHQLADSAERLRRRAGETYNQASSTVSNIVEKGRAATRRTAETTGQTAGASYTGEQTTTTY